MFEKDGDWRPCL
nr:hypothetical protein [Tanacetum cinerariifolium]